MGNLEKSLGHFELARQEYMESLTSFQTVASGSPTRCLNELSTLFYDLGLLESRRDSLTEARQYFEKAVKGFRSLVESDPNAYSPNLAKALMDLGVTNGKLGQFEDAQNDLEESLKIRRDMAKTDQRHLADIGADLVNLGALEAEQHNIVKALRYLGEARGVFQQVSAFSPEEGSRGVSQVDAIIKGLEMSQK